jgi:hypothetical protein
MKNSTTFKISLLAMLFLFLSCEKSEMNEIEFLLNKHNTEAYTITNAHLEHLPQPVQNYLIATGVVGSQYANGIKLNYTGNFKLNENADWASMEAVTYITNEPVSRHWIGEIDSPLGKMTGLDYYYNGAGKLDIRLAPSVPFMFSDGYELTVSELIAFLGELVYNPSACLNSNISWQQVTDYAAKATIEDAGLCVSGIFYFDENYLITRFESNDRYFGDTKKKLPWIVYVQDYKTFSGIEIPTTFRAVWIKPEGEYEYINAIITGLLFDVKNL